MEQGLKQKTLQERPGLSRQDVAQIDHDAGDPRVSVLKTITQAL